MSTTLLPASFTGKTASVAGWQARLPRVLARIPEELRTFVELRWADWRTHRVAEIGDEWALYEVSLGEPGVLPRWHQDDRGWRSDRKGLRHVAAAGAYARVPVWQSRERWLSLTVPVALSVHADVLRRHCVSAGLMRRWARVKSGYGHSNGRQVIARPAVLASVLGVEERQVQRANAAAREMRLEVVVEYGRMLDLDERHLAQSRGSKQRGLASEVALTIPSEILRIVLQDTPSRGLPSHPPLTSDFTHLGAASGDTKVGAPRRASTKKPRPPSLAWLLSKQLREHLGWLAGEAPGRLAPSLARFAHATYPWTAEDVAVALEQRNRRLNRPPVRTDRIRTRPAVVLATMLRDLDPYADHPRLLDLIECTTPECDGYGWLERTDQGVRPCPTCPPQRRSNPLQVEPHF